MTSQQTVGQVRQLTEEREGKDKSYEPRGNYFRATTSFIAHSLFEAYQQYSFDIDQWIACLQSAIGGKGPMVAVQVRQDIESILEAREPRKLSDLDEQNKKQLIREVAEWLAAEKFTKKLYEYHQQVEEKLRTREYSRIKIEEVVFRSDDNYFQGDIAEYVEAHYVIDTNSFRTVGMGARVTVFNLIPVNYPLPVPKEDELGQGLMLKIPNTGLVIRMVHEDYRRLTKRRVARHQQPQVESFQDAVRSRLFEHGILEQREEDLAIRQQLVHRENGEPVFSFIPPFVVLKVRIEEGQPAEYVTIQKKIPTSHPDQYVNPYNPVFLDDLKRNPHLQKKVKLYIRACKDFYARNKKLPDTRGKGNILYTDKGNVSHVDINNISEEPDYLALAYMQLIRELNSMVTTTRDPGKKQIYANKLAEILKEAKQVMERYGLKDDNELCAMGVSITYFDESKPAREFFMQSGVFDEIEYPIFWESTNILFQLEVELMKLEQEQGKITEEEKKAKEAALFEEPIYRILEQTPRAPGHQAQPLPYFQFIDYILEAKDAGDPDWVIRAAHELFAFIDRVEKGCNELCED